MSTSVLPALAVRDEDYEITVNSEDVTNSTDFELLFVGREYLASDAELFSYDLTSDNVDIGSFITTSLDDNGDPIEDNILLKIPADVVNTIIDAGIREFVIGLRARQIGGITFQIIIERFVRTKGAVVR